MKKTVLFGELMLRLKSPGKERLFQSPFFEAVFGGSEANVAVSLSILGKETVFASAFPENPLGKEAESNLKRFGVHVKPLYKQGRLGIYFLEDGACQRPSQVIYDRNGSCFATSLPNEYDWNWILEDCNWFHVSGVTPAISQETADCCIFAVNQAKKIGATVSIDLNYRKKLWKYGKSACEVMTELAKKADVLIANEEDIQNCLGIPLKNFSSTEKSNKNSDLIAENYKCLCEEVKNRFPNVKQIAITLRQSYSADKNGWSAVLLGKYGFYESTHYNIENIVERVGAGDSFAAALIYGLSEFVDSKEGEYKSLEFATAAGCLKHSIHGDFNLSKKEEIESLVAGNFNGRIQR